MLKNSEMGSSEGCREIWMGPWLANPSADRVGVYNDAKDRAGAGHTSAPTSTLPYPKHQNTRNSPEKETLKRIPY
jgi:hypothetical protein